MEFPTVILLDTGSRDSTKAIATVLKNATNSNLIMIEKNYGDNPNLIGNSPNMLREACPTEWMLLVGGDEIWPVQQLRDLKEHVANAKPGTEVGMATGKNVVWQGDWFERDAFSADRLFRPGVVWDNVRYPFEGHNLERRIQRGAVEYWPVYFWHVRHLRRSTIDNQTYYRDRKQPFFPYAGELKPIEDKHWFGEPSYVNPYMVGDVQNA